MKTLYKSLLVAIVAILAVGTASADFRWGIKAGVNVNHVDFQKIMDKAGAQQTLTDKSNQAGWMAGLMAEFTIPIVNLGADVSLLYARQNVADDAKFEKYYENQNFLDIPVNLKWKIGLPVVGKIVTPMIYTGPDFMFVLNKNTLDYISEKKCEVGWNVGIGLELLKHLQIQAGYTFGLNSVAKYAGTVENLTGIDVPDLELQDLKVKKNYWSVTAAYLF